MSSPEKMFRIFAWLKNKMSNSKCFQCNTLLSKDIVALNKKLLSRTTKRFLCLECLADHIGATTNDLLIKLTEFKEQGCELFR